MTYPWLSYAQVRAHEAEAARLGVSEVARSPRGFVRAYEQHQTAARMKRAPHPTKALTWGEERDHFVARHLAQYRAHPTSRRRLALIMWAYLPPR
jgi:hypothetical protein